MSEGPRYQIIAIAPSADSGRSARQVQVELEEAFDLDLASVLSAFMGSGVCIFSSTDLAAAKGAARKASRLGAEVMVLDDQDNVLADSRTRPKKGRPAQATRPLPGMDKQQPDPVASPAVGAAPGTEMVLIPEKEARPAPTYRPPDQVGGLAPSSSGGEVELESKAESAYMASAEQAGVRGPPPGVGSLLPPETPTPTPTPGPAAGKASGSFSYSSLELEELVALDGTSQPPGEAKRGLAAADAFAAPAVIGPEDRELELDEKPLPPIEEMVADDDEEEAGVGEDGMVAMSLVPDEDMEVERKPPPTPSPIMQATSRAASRAAELASEGADVVAERAQGGADMLKSLFADHRRLRIVIGFLVAMGGGGIYPVLHAQSAYGTHFRPLTQELANAEALEARGDEVAENRTPDAVKSRLWSLKLRYIAFTAVLWTVLAGLLAFIWFRVT